MTERRPPAGVQPAPRVGIYGGTFNPIHTGHLRAAEEVCEALALDEMRFVPSARPPHKQHHGGETAEDWIAPAAMRLAWARLATRDNERFCVDPIEIERDGPSYLVDTLREIGAQTAPAKPVFVVGRDAFSEMDGWKDPETLFTLAHFAVTSRPPIVENETLAEWAPETARRCFEMARDERSAVHRSADTWLRLVEITALDISASAIRALAWQGRSLRYLVPDAVERAILESGVYLPGGRANPDPIR